MLSVQTKQNATNMRMPISTYPEYTCPLLLTWKERALMYCINRYFQIVHIWGTERRDENKNGYLLSSYYAPRKMKYFDI